MATKQEKAGPDDPVAALMERITALGLPCPKCRRPTVGARAYSAAEGAFVGAACTACQVAFRVEAGQ